MAKERIPGKPQTLGQRFVDFLSLAVTGHRRTGTDARLQERINEAFSSLEHVAGRLSGFPATLTVAQTAAVRGNQELVHHIRQGIFTDDDIRGIETTAQILIAGAILATPSTWSEIQYCNTSSFPLAPALSASVDPGISLISYVNRSGNDYEIPQELQTFLDNHGITTASLKAIEPRSPRFVDRGIHDNTRESKAPLEFIHIIRAIGPGTYLLPAQEISQSASDSLAGLTGRTAKGRQASDYHPVPHIPTRHPALTGEPDFQNYPENASGYERTKHFALTEREKSFRYQAEFNRGKIIVAPLLADLNISVHHAK